MANRGRFGIAALIGVVGLFGTGSTVRSAVQLEDPAQIRAAIEAELAPRLAAIAGAKTDIEVGAIDPRLRLAACPALTVSPPPGNAAALSVMVSCPEPHWTVYVPVRLHAWVDAVVAAGNLAPNRPLTARDLGRGRVDMFAGNTGLETDPSHVEGMILRVGLTAGTPILSPSLDLPVIVHRGQRVLLTLTDNTMTIRATAVAMEDGRLGDSIALQNPDSRKSLHATVTGDGGAEIKF